MMTGQPQVKPTVFVEISQEAWGAAAGLSSYFTDKLKTHGQEVAEQNPKARAICSVWVLALSSVLWAGK